LLIAAHGTASLDGHLTLMALVRNARSLRPSLPITLGFVDVLLPNIADVLDSVRGLSVVVPALLSSGYHVAADIPRAVRRRGGALVTPHLGPDPLLTVALADGLATAGASGLPVVLFAAGSSDPAGWADVVAAAADLSGVLGVPVRPTSLADATLGPAELAGAAVVPYLLAEGRMFESITARALEAGAALVTNPIGTHPAVAELILRRYDETVSS
jgi:sirohydrochlorin ferrochelatase